MAAVAGTQTPILHPGAVFVAGFLVPDCRAWRATAGGGFTITYIARTAADISRAEERRAGAGLDSGAGYSTDAGALAEKPQAGQCLQKAADSLDRGALVRNAAALWCV